MTYHSTPGHAEEWEQKDFLQNVLTITGDTRCLVLPVTYTGTTITDSSSYAHNFTAPESVATWVYTTTRTPLYSFNGSTRRLYQADHADFSFGNGSDDSAFSVFALINPAGISGDTYLVCKQDYNGALYEWHLHLTNGKPYFQLHDKSASAHIGRYRNTALSTSTWYFLVGTYAGNEAEGGIKIYLDGTQVDDSSASTGSYVAMEDTAAGVGIGCMFDTYPAGMAFFNGKMGAVGVCAKELSASEVWQLSALVRGHFGV